MLSAWRASTSFLVKVKLLVFTIRPSQLSYDCLLVLESVLYLEQSLLLKSSTCRRGVNILKEPGRQVQVKVTNQSVVVSSAAEL